MKKKNKNIKILIIKKKKKLNKWIKKNFQKNKIFSLDFYILKKKISGILISTCIKKIFYIKFTNKKNHTIKRITKKYFFKKIKKILNFNKHKIILHNFKKKIFYFKKYKFQLKNKIFDIMLMSYLLNNIFKKHHEINKLYNYWLKKISNTKKKKEKKKIKNSYKILKIYLTIKKKFNKNKHIKKIYKKIDFPLTKVLYKIEKNGILINKKKLKKNKKKIEINLKKNKKKAHLLAKKKFNLRSYKETKKILLKIKNLKFTQKTKKGKICLNNKILKNISKKNKLIQTIIKYRKLYKIKSSYTDILIKKINKNTKKIHTTYFQTMTTTSRLSSRNPNLQCIPSNNKQTNFLRKSFITKQKFYIVSFDYSQIELRILAHFSKDKKLLRIFKKKKDCHIHTAKKMFKIKKNKITKQHRKIAKNINFGLIYGITPFGLSKIIKKNFKISKQYIQKYFKYFKGIKKYLKKNQNVKKKILTLSKRQLLIPKLKNKKEKFYNKHIERTFKNAPIQGTASDIVKIAMLKINYWIKKNKIKNNIKMILQIHDELLFEIKKKFIKKYCKKIKKIMEKNYFLCTPLKINIKFGKNWNDLNETI